MQEKIALYWDFENIHASAMNNDYGQNWFYNYKFKQQPAVLDIGAIMDYINSLGEVVINRAYSHWQYLGKYAPELNEHAIDLIQIYPRGGAGKNGADIRLSIDIIEDVQNMDYITTVVLISGDSDFISVGKRVRSKGKRMIGMGLRATSNQYWIKTCNEFKFYDNIISELSAGKTSDNAADIDPEERNKLVAQAMRNLTRHTGHEWIKRVRIKPALVRLDPAFDEANHGFTSFGRFMDALAKDSVLDKRAVPGQQEPEFRLHADVKVGKKSKKNSRSKKKSSGNEETDQTIDFYTSALGNQGIRLLEYPMMKEGIRIYADYVKKKQTFDDNSHLDEVTAEALKEKSEDGGVTEARKLRHIFYKCFLFKKTDDNKLGFHEDVGGVRDIEERYFRLMLKRVSDSIGDGEIDYAALSTLIFGKDNRAERLKKLHGK